MNTKIGRFEILGELGKGGMGIVYKAFDPLMYRHVAVKTLAAAVASDDYAKKRFMKEAVAAGRVSGKKSHPNIVTMYDLFEEEGQSYMVMEFVEGESLRDVIAEERTWSLEERIAVIRQVCEALDHAHELGIVHRDIKPANILVTQKRQVKLLDFGLAHLTASSFTKTHRGVGTPSYMAPEQWSGEEVDRRADVFSLAVTTYELLTKTKPFQSHNPAVLGFQVMNKRVPPLDKMDPDFPHELATVVAKGMERDPANRYPTATALSSDLGDVLGQIDERAQSLRHAVLQKAVRLDAMMAKHRSKLTEDALAPLMNDELEVDRDLLKMIGIDAASVTSLPQLERLGYLSVLAADRRLNRQEERLQVLVDQIHGVVPKSRPLPGPSETDATAVEIDVQIETSMATSVDSVTEILADPESIVALGGPHKRVGDNHWRQAAAYGIGVLVLAVAVSFGWRWSFSEGPSAEPLESARALDFDALETPIRDDVAVASARPDGAGVPNSEPLGPELGPASAPPARFVPPEDSPPNPEPERRVSFMAAPERSPTDLPADGASLDASGRPGESGTMNAAVRHGVEAEESPRGATPEDQASGVLSEPVAEGVDRATAASATPGEAALTLEARERSAIEATLEAYASAYQAMDVPSVARVFPAMDAPALNDAFEQLKSVRLEIEVHDVEIRSLFATARCLVRTLVEPKFGMAAPVTVSERRFELERRNGIWIILSAEDYE